MQDQPSVDELLRAAAAFLRERAAPALEGRDGFHARVMANVIHIARRQIALGPAAEAAERDRLRVLLQADGDLESLNRLLCERIRAGVLGPDAPGLAGHLWQTTLDKLAVDQPGYGAGQAPAGGA
jgi:hypothetical protein